MGVACVCGIIHFARLWPLARSNADTIKIQVSDFAVAKDGEYFKPAHVYDKEVVLAASPKSINPNSSFKLRLQGIGAPEYRQCWGDSATTVVLVEYRKPLARNGAIYRGAVNQID